MRELVLAARDRLVNAPDSVCLQRAWLATEAWRAHEDEPPALRRAHLFAHVLRHIELDIGSNPLFAGNTSSRPRAWMLVPEHGFGVDPQVALEYPELAGFLDGKVPQELREFWAGRSFGGTCGIGHLAVDLQRVVHQGLGAMVAEAERHADEGDEEQRVTRQAMALSLRAVIEWAGRYAGAAEEAAGRAEDPVVRAAHLRVARACRQVPARPARDLFEGLQAMALIHLAIALEGHGFSVSVGLPDRVLAPFIRPDFDPEEATDLAAAFLLKIAENSLYGRGFKSLTITVGGADHHGRDCCNPLTLAFLEAADLVRLGDPPLFLRWHPAIDLAVKRRAAELLASGLSMPLLVNDAPTAAGFESAGVAPEDAWEYCVVGCNELGIPGRSAESATATAGSVLYPELLNQVLLQDPDPDSLASMEQVLACLEERMASRLTEMRRNGLAHRERTARCVPTPFTSALMRGCIKRGCDLLVGMDYHLPGVYERGLTNAANALAAIEAVVFQERSLSLPELVDALRAGLPDAALRERLRAAPKWGCDDDRADRWALALVEMRERVLNAVDAEFGSRPHLSCHVVRSLHYLDGKRIGATLDGRPAGAPLADSIGAEVGTAAAGPTGVLRSVLKLDAARLYRGGTNLNITLSRRDADPETLLGLVEGFFAAGGQELQINALDAETLRRARREPDTHRDLVVRVAGLSARFVDLSPKHQEELIARAEAAA